MRNIITRYNEQGLLGLEDNRSYNPGAPTILNKQEQNSLSEAIMKNIDNNEPWSGKQTIKWVKETIGGKVSLQSSYNYMHKLGFSLQSPRPRHKLANLQEQEYFKKNVYLSE